MTAGLCPRRTAAPAGRQLVAQRVERRLARLLVAVEPGLRPGVVRREVDEPGRTVEQPARRRDACCSCFVFAIAVSVPEDASRCPAARRARPYDALMDLPVMPPVQPMLAKSVKGIPDPAKHGGLLFEPKWDGFRAIVFRDGDEIEIASRNTKPLTRYFPEVVEAVRASMPERCVRRRRDLRGHRRPAGVREAPGAHPPCRLAGADARRDHAGGVRRVRPARARRRVAGARAVRGASARGSRRHSQTPARRSTSPAPRRTRRRPRTGSSSSKAPASTAWWPSRWARRTSRTCARC